MSFLRNPRGPGNPASRLELERRPEAGVLAEREIAAHAQELVLAVVVGDLVGEAEPAIRLGIEAVQDLRRAGKARGSSRSGSARPGPGGCRSGAIGASATARAIGRWATSTARSLAVAAELRCAREPMAESRRPAHVAGVSGVDPEIDVGESLGPIGRRSAWSPSPGQHGDPQSRRIPGDTDRGPGASASSDDRSGKAKSRQVEQPPAAGRRGNAVNPRARMRPGETRTPGVRGFGHRHRPPAEPGRLIRAVSTYGLGLENGFGLTRAPDDHADPQPDKRTAMLNRSGPRRR